MGDIEDSRFQTLIKFVVFVHIGDIIYTDQGDIWHGTILLLPLDARTQSG